MILAYLRFELCPKTIKTDHSVVAALAAELAAVSVLV
jgi:hypothetical protein